MDDIAKDMLNESKFLEVFKGKDKPKTELELLIEGYETQLRTLVKIRIDQQFIDYLILAEPQNQEAAKQKANMERNLNNQRKVTAIIREQILELMKDIRAN